MLVHRRGVGGVEQPEWRHLARKGRGEQHVVRLERRSDLPADLLRVPQRPVDVDAGERAVVAEQHLGERLDIAGSQLAAELCEPVVDGDDEVGAHEHRRGHPDIGRVEGGGHLLDVVAEALAELRGVEDRLFDGRVEVDAVAGAGGQTDPQRPRPSVGGVEEAAPMRARRGEGLSGQHAGDDVEEHGAVTHGRGDGVRHRHGTGKGPGIRRAGGSTAARFESDQAVHGRRDPDRATAVGGVRGRYQPGSDRGRGPTARAAGGPGQVAGVVRWTEEL